MTTRKLGRTALIAVLALSIIMSITGGTIAWFTDEVTSTGNEIKAGNLDVKLYYKASSTAEWEEVTESTKLFDEDALYEPGYTEVIPVKIENAGTLALKYQLGIIAGDKVKTLSKLGNEIDLGEYLYFAYVEGAVPADRDTAAAKATVKVNDVEKTAYASLLPNNEKEGYLVLTMPTTIGNEANPAGAAPSIKLGVKLEAIQKDHEEDAFGSDYDVNANLPEAWTGELGTLPAENNNVITISTAEELAAFAASVNNGNSFSGKTVKLANHINLANKPWTPIGACNTPAYFQGTFDGNGFTISGLNVDKSTDDYKYSTSGFFGWIDAAAATIKNVNFEGATVKGSHWVGVVAGYMTGEISDCKVNNATVMGFNVNGDANGDKVGGIVGYMNTGAGKLDGNTVTNSTLVANRDVAGIAGAVATTNKVTNNHVENVSITYATDYAAEIVSKKTAVVVDETNTATNVTITKGEMVKEGVLKVANNSYEITGVNGLMNVYAIIDDATCGEGNSLKIKLMSDVDLSGKTWEPINKMWVEFDGNGHTISNLTSNAWQAGLFGYLGGGSIKNLTLENVNVTGAQAGAFAGAMEGRIENCTLTGNNIITWAEKHQHDDPNAAVETWSGVGAICGVAQPLTVNATIAEGTTVKIVKTGIDTDAPYVNDITGYISKTQGTVNNNGTITVVE